MRRPAALVGRTRRKSAWIDVAHVCCVQICWIRSASRRESAVFLTFFVSIVHRDHAVVEEDMTLCIETAYFSRQSIIPFFLNSGTDVNSPGSCVRTDLKRGVWLYKGISSRPVFAEKSGFMVAIYCYHECCQRTRVATDFGAVKTRYRVGQTDTCARHTLLPASSLENAQVT